MQQMEHRTDLVTRIVQLDVGPCNTNTSYVNSRRYLCG